MKHNRPEERERRPGQEYSRNTVNNILRKIKTSNDIYDVEDEILLEERREHIEAIR
jgi:hypothetical protein